MTLSTISFWTPGTSPSLGWTGISGWLPVVPIAFSVAYWAITAILLRRRFRGPEKEEAGATVPDGRPDTGPLPPVAFMRPVKRGVPDLDGKARRLVTSVRPGDQVFFGVDNPEDFAVCEAACAAVPAGATAKVIFCTPAFGMASETAGWPLNPKIAKLTAMAPHAEKGPQLWIVSDSEALPDRRFMDAFRAEWRATGAAALTAGYRFAGEKNLPQQLDHLPALLTLWPGLAVAEWGTKSEEGGLRFTLGACTGIRRADLEAVGGWEAFGSFLAEDNRLGAALGAAKKPARLSRELLALDSDPIGWHDWLRHQHRVAVTYRVCNPAGALGMGMTHGVTWSFLLAALHPGSPVGWAIVAGTLATRIITARQNARLLRFPVEPRRGRFALLTLAASLAETGFWLAAWLPLPVRWGTRSYRIGPQGRLRAGV